MTTSPTSTTPTEAQKTEVTDPNKSAEPTPATRFKFSLSEGILLATASASAYLWTFQYERGFASHFGVPAQFINVSLINVLFVAALVIGVIFTAIPVANALVMIFFPRVSSHPLLLRHATTMFILLPIALFPAYIYGTRLALLGGLGMLAFMVLYVFVLPLLNRREVGYIKKLEVQAERDRSTGATTLIGLVSRRLGPNLTLGVYLFIYSFFFATFAGDATATNQKEFLVTTLPSSTNEVVLLRAYGDDLIFAPFNRNTKEVQKSFTILKVADLKTPLTLEAVGPLNPVTVKPQAEKPSPMPSPSPQSSSVATPAALPVSPSK